MFENITKEISGNQYTLYEANFEILSIILFSFLFGWFLRKAWEKYKIEKNENKEILNQDKKEKEIIKTEEIKKNEKENKEIKKEDKKLISPTGFAFDNLKIIEGIGPKIESLLKRNGIENWKDLSEKKPEELKEILNKAGDRFTFHNPSSWPEQAMLAYQEKWEELEEFQNFLNGGRIN